MVLEYDEAVTFYGSLDFNRAVPSLHPYYIAADAKRASELTPIFFVHVEGEALFYHGFHLANVPGTGLFDIQSAYGYGGPFVVGGDERFLTEAWSAYLSWCRDKGVMVEFIRFHPLLENWCYYRGETLENRITVWIDLQDGDLLSTYSTRVRTAVKKALKSGLRIEWVNPERFLKVFPTMYRETMAGKNVADFYLFNDPYFARMAEWNSSHLALCLMDEEPVAAAIFLTGSAIMEYHLSASSTLGKSLAATNLIIHEAALLAKNLGCRALHLGGGNDSCREDPLFFFKSGFSQNRAVFKIGKYIHHRDAYASMQAAWRNEYGESEGSRVLFYR